MKKRCKASEILHGSRIDYIKYVSEILFIATTAQIDTLWKRKVMCDSLNFDVSQMILLVSLVWLLISSCISKNNAYHLGLFREELLNWNLWESLVSCDVRIYRLVSNNTNYGKIKGKVILWYCCNREKNVTAWYYFANKRFWAPFDFWKKVFRRLLKRQVSLSASLPSWKL